MSIRVQARLVGRHVRADSSQRPMRFIGAL
jgi:hypothetical protein